MADRAKVDKGLERCLSGKVPFGCGECPYYGDEVYTDAWSCRLSLMRDANELLKEKHPKTGHWQDKYEGIATCSARCSCCKKVSSGFATDNGFSFDYRYHEYCPKCGAKMDNAEEE